LGFPQVKNGKPGLNFDARQTINMIFFHSSKDEVNGFLAGPD
jgi:hypothetical protein